MVIMAKATNTVDSTEKEVVKFSKEKILQIGKYRNRVDLLNVLLVTDKVYSYEEVDTLLEEFMKGKGE